MSLLCALCNTYTILSVSIIHATSPACQSETFSIVPGASYVDRGWYGRRGRRACDVRKEPLHDALAPAQIRQRYTLVRQVCLVLHIPNNVSTHRTKRGKIILRTELWPRGRWSAWHENSFSKYGTDGMDCTTPNEHHETSSANRKHTHPSLPDPQRVHAPLVLHRTLQRVEPGVVQAPQPPVRRLVDRDLQPHTPQVSHAYTSRTKTVRTLSVFGERMRPNSVLRCSCTAAAIASNAWSGTIRTEICARTFDGITVESAPPRRQC